MELILLLLHFKLNKNERRRDFTARGAYRCRPRRTTRRWQKVMLKALGILIYIASLLIHGYWGVRDVAFWVAMYHMLQNLALSLICIDAMVDRQKYLVVFTGGVTYFASAFVFYAYTLATNQLIYFSNCGAAGLVLSGLIVIAIILTSIDYYVRRRKQ